MDVRIVGGPSASISLSELEEPRACWIAHRDQDCLSKSDAESIGRKLTAVLLPPEIEHAIQVCGREAFVRKEALRIRFSIADPSLFWIPWELLYLKRTAPEEPYDGLLGLQPGVRIVRTRTTEDCRETQPEETLRVLTILANPSTTAFPGLSWLTAEDRAIRSRFGKRGSSHKVHAIHDALSAVVRRAIADQRPHIVHFSGHCVRKPTGSFLVLQGEKGETLLPAEEFAGWLVGAGVRLAVINACDSAGWSNGIAEIISEAGVPAVLAMQGKAADANAPDMTRTFYNAIVDGAEVDEALAELRQAHTTPERVCFGPALYMRTARHILVSREDTREPIGNLPAPESAFIGRTSELAEIVGEFRHGNRLVTLTGGGGIGKSRLAQEAGLGLASVFPDGVWQVQCDAVMDRDSLYFAIAGTLQIPTGNGESVANTVSKYLSDQSVLLILDGFEGAIAAGNGPLVRELVDGMDGGCLVTSRSRLNVPGEVVVPLDSLGLTDKTDGISESARLFLQAASLSEAKVSGAELAAIEQICQLLQGMPLAIQLAGKRHFVLGLQDLLELLQASQLGTLDGDLSPLSRAIKHSLDLISEEDRHLLWQIAVFVGSFTWSDFQAIASGEKYSLIDRLSRLSGNGLVILERISGQHRYRILDTVREYMSRTVQTEHLASERLIARERHCSHYVDKSQRLAEMMQDGKWTECWAELWTSIGNFRAALAFAGAHGRLADVCSLTLSLARPFSEAGLGQDFDHLIEVGLSALRATGDAEGECKILGLLGAVAARRAGGEAACREHWLARAALGAKIGNRIVAADSFIDIAVQYQQVNNRSETERYLQMAEEHLQLSTVPSPELYATISIIRATDALRDGNVEAARDHARTAEERMRGADNEDRLLFVHLNLGRIWAQLKEIEPAGVEFTITLIGAMKAKRLFLAATALMELAALFEICNLLETAYLCLLCAERILKDVRSRHHGSAEIRLAGFCERHAISEQFREQWRKVPWEEAVVEIIHRCRSRFLPEDPNSS